LHSYFADVNLAYGGKSPSDKYSVKFIVEEVELKYFERA
jgi:hypothetical protein